MHKSWKIGFAFFFLLVLALSFLEANEPEPLNMNPSYSGKDKIPLGSFAFFESWKNTREIKEINQPPFEFLAKEEPPDGIYFFLNDHVVFDDNELNKVLAWVSRGNTVFVSAGYIGKNLLDTLKLEARTNLRNTDFKSRPGLKLKNEAEMPKLNFDIEALIFTKTDSLEHNVLGTAVFAEEPLEQKPNFVQTSFGKGQIFVHSTPEAFSNYFLLQQENYQYAEAVLAYLDPSETLLWDNYYKSGKSFYSSPLYYLLANRALKWAYYFVLLASVLYLVFQGKRRQRPIPIVKALENKTYEYTRNISNLYLEQNRYREMTIKKIELFLDYIRSQYRLSTQELDSEFEQKLMARSGNNETATRDLFSKIRQLRAQQNISKEEFLHLTRAIASFKNPKNGKSGNPV
ncbi:DUF4350 domain-containing protein [Salegentibacter sediminis]|uniref:DUF4350 domain-containing protein n=1 Tax=Salegentibacter sediminis TaxID=1930251 RepID=UPI0009BF4EAB|nr:DUF4350 domain-containing protein [Salegentibacter sediminis]